MKPHSSHARVFLPLLTAALLGTAPSRLPAQGPGGAARLDFQPTVNTQWLHQPPRVKQWPAVRKLAQPTPEGNALIIVEWEDPRAVTRIVPIYLDARPRALRDDGQGGDEKSDDGRYSAVVPLDVGKLVTHQQQVMKTAGVTVKSGFIEQARFEGRVLGPVNKAPVIDLAAWDVGKDITLAPFSSPPANEVWTRALLIVDPKTVDQARAKGMGEWSFGHVMSKLAETGGVHPGDFAREWLRSWENPDAINGFPADGRPNVSKILRSNWPLDADGRLDVAKAPFRLLAIVHRIDLRNDVLLGGPGSAGENSMVYGAFDGAGNAISFTVIFEFGIRVSNNEEIKKEGTDWHNLTQWAPGDPLHDNALVALTERFINPAVGGYNARLDQVRTNEIIGGGWQLREFKIALGGDMHGFLEPVTVKQTPQHTRNTNAPDTSSNPNIALRWINENARDIANGQHILPARGFLNEPLLGAVSNEDGPQTGPWFVGAGLSPASVRQKFALNTCNGCHTAETGTGFTHITSRNETQTAQLSAFMTQHTMPDPGDAGMSLQFGEKSRRVTHLDELVNLPGIFSLFHLPLNATH